MSSAGQDPNKYIREHMIEPLRAFREKVLPLNQTHNTSVQECTDLLLGLLLGTDGGIAMQGPASDSLAELLGQFIDAEWPLSSSCPYIQGTTPPITLEGRMLEVALICERAAHKLEANLRPLTSAPGFLSRLADLGGGDEKEEGDTNVALETFQEKYSFDLEMDGPITEPLPRLPSTTSSIIKALGVVGTIALGAIVLNALTPVQRRRVDDVKSILGPGSWNDAEIEALVSAGYLDPNAIAAIIRGGSFATFNDANVAKMVNQLTDAQQQKVIANVEAYQKTHPGLTSHQVYNYLRYIKMKAQLQMLEDDILGKNPSDPLAQAIAKMYPAEVLALVARLEKNVRNNLSAVTDPFAVTDNDLNGWYSNLTGVWGEWATIEYYAGKGTLVGFSAPVSGGEVDIKIMEGGIVKWIEVKNVQTVKNAWRKALDQAAKLAKNGAKYVIIQLPQQNPSTGPSPQQLKNLDTLRRLYPGITFEVRYGPPTSFDPPSNNWGAYLP